MPASIKFMPFYYNILIICKITTLITTSFNILIINKIFYLLKSVENFFPYYSILIISNLISIFNNIH